jgi:hypothetical protein
MAAAWQLLLLLQLSALYLTSTQAGNCDVSNIDKWDCGQMGTNQAQCEADGCCWVPVTANHNASGS